MYKHCTTEESVSRQRQLEQCLMELMQTVPYTHITITHICDGAGISRKSFYRYFGSKDGCLCALLDHCIMEGAAYYLPENSDNSDVHTLYERFFTYWQRMQPLLDALAKNNLSLQLVERMMVNMEQEERDLHKFLGGIENDSTEQMLFFTSGVMGLVLSWHHGGFQKTAAQMAAIMEKVTLH